MKLNYAIICATVLAAFCTSVFSQSGKTRTEVRQELQDAIRNGDIIAGDRFVTLREIYPHKYPKQLVQIGKTRAQVREELEEAIRNGDVIDNVELGLSRSQLRPDLFPAKPAVVGKTREQVRKELEEAIRTGDILANGESGLKRNELEPHKYPKMSNSSKKATYDRVGSK